MATGLAIGIAAMWCHGAVALDVPRPPVPPATGGSCMVTAHPGASVFAVTVEYPDRIMVMTGHVRVAPTLPILRILHVGLHDTPTLVFRQDGLGFRPSDVDMRGDCNLPPQDTDLPILPYFPKQS